MRRKKRQGLAGVTLIALITLAGCGKSEDAAMFKAAKNESNAAAGALSASMPTDAPATEYADRSSPNKPQAASKATSGEGKGVLTLVSLTDSQPDRYLIKNATVNIETSDPRRVSEQLLAFARMVRGYISDSHETVDGLGARSITMQFRVPAAQFEASMQQVETLGKILDKQVNTEDVTEEFVDSQARARNLKSTELRLLDHLSKTGKLSDTLLIENELTRVRQQIEQIEGRLKFLAHRVAYSTFNITVHETPRAQAIIPPQTFSSGKVTSDATRSLVDFGQSLWSIVIWVGVWSIFWLPLVLIVRALLQQRHRRISTPPSH